MIRLELRQRPVVFFALFFISGLPPNRESGSPGIGKEHQNLLFNQVYIEG